MIHISEKKCVACEGGVPPLTSKEAAELMLQLADGWDLHEGKLRRWFNFKDFKGAMDFANAVAGIAEAEGHHPEMQISYGKVLVELWTHAIHGLSENDFIVAAKIDKLSS